MMKFLFGLIVLLHLSDCTTPYNMDLSSEIYHQLNNLTNYTVTSTETLRVPVANKRVTRRSCLSTFVKELKHLLNNTNMTQNETLLQKLKANVGELDQHQGTDVNSAKCNFFAYKTGDNTTIFKRYATYLTKLNRRSG